MHVLHVVGARPQFVKLAPVVRALAGAAGDAAGARTTDARGERPRCEQTVLHTGQHYDDEMSARFFVELELPEPTINLGVGSGPHGEQTGRMLAGIEQALQQLRPDTVLVYGDTNSTLAGALAAVKLRVPVAHVEAGLRSGIRAMPEEINRIAADHVCDLLFAPTRAAVMHLEREGLGSRTLEVGDVMADAVLQGALRARANGRALDRFGLRERRFALATIHRAASTTARELPRLLEAIDRVSERFEAIVLPLHPRTRAAAAEHCPRWRPAEQVRVCEPLGYHDVLQLLDAAAVVLTDSGGLQKEAFLLGTPCVTLRDETEWVESVEAGGNVLAGSEPASVLGALERLAAAAPAREVLAARAAACYGHGTAAVRIAAVLLGHRLGGRDGF